jgi:hypothetical protein
MAEVTGSMRRTEDIALDLLKFVAAQANVGSKAAGDDGFRCAFGGEVGGSGDASAGAVCEVQAGG